MRGWQIVARSYAVTAANGVERRTLAEEFSMDLHQSGKVAVVTGVSKGIGLAVVRALAAEGVSVVAGARDVTGDLSRLAAEFPDRAGNVTGADFVVDGGLVTTL
jgi:3-oxoacyl-ACP reductase-like protein